MSRTTHVQISSLTVIILQVPSSALKFWHNCYLSNLYFTDAIVKLYGEDNRSAICDAICRVLRGVGDWNGRRTLRRKTG